MEIIIKTEHGGTFTFTDKDAKAYYVRIEDTNGDLLSTHSISKEDIVRLAKAS